MMAQCQTPTYFSGCRGVFFNQRPETTDNMSRDTLSTRMFGGYVGDGGTMSTLQPHVDDVYPTTSTSRQIPVLGRV